MPVRKNKKVIGMMKDEFGRKIMKEFVGARPKMYSYLIDGNQEEKRQRVIRRVI